MTITVSEEKNSQGIVYFEDFDADENNHGVKCF